MIKSLPSLRFDDRWDPDSVCIRINLSRPLTLREIALFEKVIRSWSDDYYNQQLLSYIDKELDWYFGGLGQWVQVFVDFSSTVETHVSGAITQVLIGSAGNEANPGLETKKVGQAVAALRDSLNVAGLIDSVWVGSDYGDWPYPAETESI